MMGPQRYGYVAIAVVSILTALVGSTAQPRFDRTKIVKAEKAIALRQPLVPCRPEGPPDGLIRVTPTGVQINDPDVELLEDQIVTTEMDLTTDMPQLLGGSDGSLAESGCVTSFDIDQPLPAMTPPNSLVPPPSPPPATAPYGSGLWPLTFVPPAHCREAKTSTAACGARLDCALPFCGRDIIFVHGMIDEALVDLVKAKSGVESAFGALLPWPQADSAFTAPGGYFREHAYGRWNNYILNKLGPAYKRANAIRPPRFLVIGWPTTQRMEVGIHATLSQTARAMQTGHGVMTLNLNQPGTPIIPAQLYQSGFCGKGCVVVSHSTGGPVTLAALKMAATGGRPWLPAGFQQLPQYIKGHVASHPALSGSELAMRAISAGNNVGGGCAYALDLLKEIAPNSSLPSGTNPCTAFLHLNNTVLMDLMPPVMDSLWRPVMTAPVQPAAAVPTVIVAAGHPTAKALIHWSAPILPGFDDGVLSVDNQLGRRWYPNGAPRSLSLHSWGLLGAKYFDRGSPTAKSVAYFIDQNRELQHRSGSHAGAPNPFLAPNGMVLTDMSTNEVSGMSSGLPNVFSFLQSTSDHFFPRYVGGSNPSSQPNDSDHGCPPGSYSYRPTGNYFGPQASVNEESRAVFDPIVYTDQNRTLFAFAESLTGTIPILSSQLKPAVESETKGRYIRLRFKLLKIDKTFWIWKRQYVRMRDWRCRDEIDYTFDFAFRR